MSAGSAADLVGRYTGVTRAAMAMVGQMSPWAMAVQAQQVALALADGNLLAVKDMPRPGPPPQDWRLQREALYAVQDEVARRLWARKRIVYDLDPHLWAALGEVDEDTILPGGVLRHLPHPDPFIALPEPVVVTINEKDRLRIGGFFVLGASRGEPGTQVPVGDTEFTVTSMVSTHASSASGDLRLLIAGEVEDHQGKPRWLQSGFRDMVVSRVTLEVGDGGDKILSQLIDAIAQRFDEATWSKASEAGGFEATVRPLITKCVSALIYLCSTNAELRPYPAGVTRRAVKGAAKPPKVIEVGYLTGAALRAWAQREKTASAGGDGSPRRPHIRRAHFHLYWTGPGRTVPRMKWLPPIPVNATGQDAEQATIVPVT